MLNKINVIGAKVHNLKNVSITLPRNKLIVFTGLSGSGKSSLAFDTIYAEGQRRYMESLSSYARQFLHQLDKPDVDHIEGLSPAISIEQKTASHNPRSTVATVTEIYDYFRLLYASIGIAHCPSCKKPVKKQSLQEIVDHIMSWDMDQKIMVLAPLLREKKGTHKDLLEKLQKEGFSRVCINGTLHKLGDDIALEKNKKHTIRLVIDRLTLSSSNQTRLTESIETGLRQTDGLIEIDLIDQKKSILFSEQFACADCHVSLPEINHRLFSFNSPMGACTACKGLGDTYDFDPDLVIEHPDQPVRTCTGKVLNLDNTFYGRHLNQTAKKHGFDWDTPFKTLTKKQQNIVLYGSTTEQTADPFLAGTADDYQGRQGDWEGILTNLRRRYYQTHSEGMRFFFRGYMSAYPCQSCQGSRLKPAARSVTIGALTIYELTQLSVRKLVPFFDALKLTEKELEISRQILKEIQDRLSFLYNVGLQYLTLSRRTGSLSGGEYQRIRLATQIGAGLTGVLYVLDEPSIGLHQRDNLKLIETLVNLKNLGNTLIVVEHDEDMMRAAEHIVDIGPGAGKKGGSIVFSGNYKKLLNSKTETADYLTGKKSVSLSEKKRPKGPAKKLSIYKATENNLKSVTAHFPLGNLVCVTGVSGSGKSTLINGTLKKALMRHFHNSKERPGKFQKLAGTEHIDKVITIDQSPIGRTPRSNPVTYTQIFTPIRELFAQTPEAKVRGFKPGRFSFNVKGGRCESCEGDGLVKIEMHFLSDVYVTCEVCKGKRYNDETLAVKFKGYTISDILNLSVDEAADVFKNIPVIYKKIETLQKVGLGYVSLGQNATTLSGGEAQRVKLAKELSKRSTGKTLYLLDEPTTGLHFSDIQKLLTVLNDLVNTGNTVIVIEHNLDVIRNADHLIDMGPEGGEGGGEIIAEGSPLAVSKVAKSHTGQFLKKLLL